MTARLSEEDMSVLRFGSREQVEQIIEARTADLTETALYHQRLHSQTFRENQALLRRAEKAEAALDRLEQQVHADDGFIARMVDAEEGCSAAKAELADLRGRIEALADECQAHSNNVSKFIDAEHADNLREVLATEPAETS